MLLSLFLTDDKSFAKSFRSLAPPSKSCDSACRQFTSLRMPLTGESKNFVRSTFSIVPLPSLCAPSCLPAWGKESAAVAPLYFPSVDFLFTPLPVVPCSTSNSNAKERDTGDGLFAHPPLARPVCFVLTWLVSISGMLPIKCLIHRSALKPFRPLAPPSWRTV